MPESSIGDNGSRVSRSGNRRGVVPAGRPASRSASALTSLVVFLVVLSLSSLGCDGNGGGGPTGPTAESLTAEGWELFTAGDLAAAQGKFGEAIAADSTHADAWNGAGWCQAYTGLLSQAVESFQEANAEGLMAAEAWAGLAAVYRDLPDELMALASADSALARDPLFDFPHRAGVDSLDLHLLRGQVQVGLAGEYLIGAQEEADFLSPGNGIDPEDPGTWEVGGEVFTAYIHALIHLLMIVEEVVGGDLP